MLQPGGRVILSGLMDNLGKHEPSAWSSSSMQVANSYLNSTEGKHNIKSIMQYNIKTINKY